MSFNRERIYLPSKAKIAVLTFNRNLSTGKQSFLTILISLLFGNPGID
jgi:hypothetical protein